MFASFLYFRFSACTLQCFHTRYTHESENVKEKEKKWDINDGWSCGSGKPNSDSAVVRSSVLLKCILFLLFYFWLEKSHNCLERILFAAVTAVAAIKSDVNTYCTRMRLRRPMLVVSHCTGSYFASRCSSFAFESERNGERESANNGQRKRGKFHFVRHFCSIRICLYFVPLLFCFCCLCAIVSIVSFCSHWADSADVANCFAFQCVYHQHHHHSRWRRLHLLSRSAVRLDGRSVLVHSASYTILSEHHVETLTNTANRVHTMCAVTRLDRLHLTAIEYTYGCQFEWAYQYDLLALKQLCWKRVMVYGQFPVFKKFLFRFNISKTGSERHLNFFVWYPYDLVSLAALRGHYRIVCEHNVNHCVEINANQHNMESEHRRLHFGVR